MVLVSWEGERGGMANRHVIIYRTVTVTHTHERDVGRYICTLLPRAVVRVLATVRYGAIEIGHWDVSTVWYGAIEIRPWDVSSSFLNRG